jgi:RNA polymerase sigma-70 factor (ECF subfamily)
MKGRKSRFDVIGQLSALRRYAWVLTRDHSRSEDLVHDALVRAYEGRRTFRADGDLRGWLFSILHNTFISGLRRYRAESKRDQDLAETMAPQTDAGQEHAVRLAQIRNAFLSLPDEQRAALHHVAIEGMSYQEAAQAIGIPIGTLMSRLGRARDALRVLEQGADAHDTTPATPSRHRLRLVGGSNDPVD